MPTHFATFGSSQLEGFNINPMKVMLTIPGTTEEQLRAVLQCHPFNGKFCTTYPISEADRMSMDYGLVQYTLQELVGTYPIHTITVKQYYSYRAIDIEPVFVDGTTKSECSLYDKDGKFLFCDDYIKVTL